MVVMTLLPQSRPLTRADLDAMPDDGRSLSPRSSSLTSWSRAGAT